VENAVRMAGLFEKVLWEVDETGEKAEFQDLWMSRIRDMLIEHREIDNWLQVETA
jgi:hypothetical protein